MSMDNNKMNDAIKSKLIEYQTNFITDKRPLDLITMVKLQL